MVVGNFGNSYGKMLHKVSNQTPALLLASSSHLRWQVLRKSGIKFVSHVWPFCHCPDDSVVNSCGEPEPDKRERWKRLNPRDWWPLNLPNGYRKCHDGDSVSLWADKLTYKVCQLQLERTGLPAASRGSRWWCCADGRGSKIFLFLQLSQT